MARSVVSEVEEEYGQPFWDVVAAYAADGNSMAMTARILGYKDGSALWYLIKHHKKEIAFPKMGYCNAVQNPDPMADSVKRSISQAKIKKDISAAGKYLRATGESAEQAISRMCATHTATEVANHIGWNNVTCMRAWMKLRGLSAEFKKVKPIPPRRNGWGSINLIPASRAQSSASR